MCNREKHDNIQEPTKKIIMGGSGGFFGTGKIDPKEYIKKSRETEEKTLNAEFVTEVNKLISDLLVSKNERPIEEIRRHLDEIKSAISSNIEDTIDLNFGGSVTKHTYVNGLSDIDSLAILNKTELSSKSPHEVLDYFYETLKKKLPKTDIQKGALAITINYSDNIQIQILPAIRTTTGIKIAASNGKNEWSKVIKPTKFAEKLSQINSANSQKIVPVIKLAKYLISKLPEKRQTTGYHTESLAIEVFKNYAGSNNSKELLKHFFSSASEVVLKRIKDTTGQSLHVDDYLGQNNSVQRLMISDSFSQLSRKMQNADGAQDIDMWKSILE
ncbi:MAG: nucleotidyltransferase [Ignavibacteriales bacterium]|nr:nucleotidyltransferase [Ignavibacteriales bacterium]